MSIINRQWFPLSLLAATATDPYPHRKEKQNEETSALTLLIATTLFVPSSAKSPQPGPDTGSITGDVVVAMKHVDGGRSTDYAVFVDTSTESQSSDGQVDHIFRLQATAQPGTEHHIVIRSARIAWSPGWVSIQDESVGHLTFTIQEEQDSPAPDLRILAAMPSDWTVEGYGLAHTVGWNITLPNGGLSDDAFVDLFGMAGSSVCNAGGPNSQACSVTCGNTGCSVQCKDGHTACCKCGITTPSCTCS